MVTHYNVRRAIDILAQCKDATWAALREISKVLDATVKLPRGTTNGGAGQVATMQTSFIGLLAGLAGAIVLVYLLIVVNFQCWLDPLIIITALPAALAGIVMLPFRHANHD